MIRTYGLFGLRSSLPDQLGDPGQVLPVFNAINLPILAVVYSPVYATESNLDRLLQNV